MADSNYSSGLNSIKISDYSTFFFDWREDATRDYHDGFLRLRWQGDRLGEALGSARLADTNTSRVFEIDIDADYLTEHMASFVLHRSGGTNASFYSREEADATLRPFLEVTYANGETRTFDATRDTYINSTTNKPLGYGNTFSTNGDILIAFDEFVPSASVTSARLVLTTNDRQYGDQDIIVHAPKLDLPEIGEIDVPVVPESELYLSLTGAEILGKGVGDAEYRIRGDVIDGISLPGTNTAFNRITEFKSDSDTVYAVEIIRFDKTFNPSMGGKVGGFANTHASGLDVQSPNGPAGWGGRIADGDSYAFRLNFNAYDDDHPLADEYFSLGSYAYYIDNGTYNGDVRPGKIPVPKGEFVALQHMVKLNTVYEDGTALSDGEFALWVNGKLSVHMTGLKIRDYAPLKHLISFEEFLELSRVHTFWHDVYFGGVGYHEVDHPPHMVSLGQLWVGEGLPNQETIMARVDELNAQPAPELWGDALDHPSVKTPEDALEDVDRIDVTGNGIFIAKSDAERFIASEKDDIIQGNAETFRDDLVTGFSATDSIFLNAGRDEIRSIKQKGDLVTISFANGSDFIISLESGYGKGGLQLFSEGAGLVSRYVDGIASLTEGRAVVEGSINGLTQADYLSADNSRAFELTLEDSEAGYANSLGVYEIAEDGSIQNVRIVAADTRGEDDSIIIDGISEGSTLHFFLLQDGANRLSAATLASDNLDIEVRDGLAVLTDGGADVSATIFVSHDDSLNADGMAHVLSGLNAEGGYTIGFEDLMRGEGGPSDNDFQDVVFTVEAIAPPPEFIG